MQDRKKEIETIKQQKDKNKQTNKTKNRKQKSKGDKSGVGNPRKEIRNHRCVYQQQNTRDGREKL
jgi:hypothetical protein